MQSKTVLKHALLIVTVTGSMLFLVFQIILPSIFTGAAGFIYTKTPSGSSVSSPLSFNIQGTFGVDFCANPLAVAYKLWARASSNGTLYTTTLMRHTQGEVVNDTLGLSLPIGGYEGVGMTCYRNYTGDSYPDGSSIVLEGAFNIIATPAPTPTPTPTPTPESTTAPASATSSNQPKTGTINVVKVVVNDNGGTRVVSDFPLFVNDVSVISGQTNTFSAPGPVFTITETGDSNYEQTFSSDCDSNGQLNLNPGDNKFCIVTNDDIVTINNITAIQLPDTGIITPPVPPLIDVVKVPSPLALPGGPGPVTYTYTLSNIGIVPVTNLTMVGDTCSPINLVYGDINGDSKLDVSEAWTYRCSTTLSATHTNTVTTTGWANGISAVDIAAATVVVGVPRLPDTGLPAKIVIPPLIHVTKIPNPLTLPVGGGVVTYTERVTNPGTVALSNVRLTDDKCSPMKYIFGDTNKNSKLDITETWIYTCKTDLIKTTTNTATVSGVANGLTAKDFAITTVIVANAAPTTSNVDKLSGIEIILWDLLILLVIIVILILLYEERRKQTNT